ncbi:hypothetical protein SK128_003035 [Halocaridina rubra]|uniref:Uncharacterized protein n=1 Tax=Halocaridina rubra TaxID=373956 RepID=A0AAN9A7T8_HALRR
MADKSESLQLPSLVAQIRVNMKLGDSNEEGYEPQSFRVLIQSSIEKEAEKADETEEIQSQPIVWMLEGFIKSFQRAKE